MPNTVPAAATGLPVAHTAEDTAEAARILETAESRGEKFAWHPAPFTYLWTTPDGRQYSCTITDRTMKPVAEAMRALLKLRGDGHFAQGAHS